MKLFTKAQLEEKFDDLKKIKDRASNEYFFKYMQLVISFGRPTKLTELGEREGKRLYKKWLAGEKLPREELILIGFLLNDISCMEEDSKTLLDVKTIYNQMMTIYRPDFAYMQNFGQSRLLEAGYVDSNPNYIKEIEQMFLSELVDQDPEQSRMVETGEMPIYDEIKVCPYCGKQFVESTEDLFKHVKSEHGKK